MAQRACWHADRSCHACRAVSALVGCAEVRRWSQGAARADWRKWRRVIIRQTSDMRGMPEVKTPARTRVPEDMVGPCSVFSCEFIGLPPEASGDLVVEALSDEVGVKRPFFLGISIIMPPIFSLGWLAGDSGGHSNKSRRGTDPRR